MNRRLVRKIREYSIGELLRLGPRYLRDRIAHRVIATYYRQALHADPHRRAHRQRAAINRLSGGGTILFLCRGNICRAPFAERYARQRLTTRGLDEIKVNSAGLLELTDPTSPADAQTAATQFDIELDDHRATPTDTATIERADLILLMDYRNYRNFTKQYPDAADRMYLLGLFSNTDEMELADPHGHGPEAFETAYNEISTCIDNVVDEVARHRTHFSATEQVLGS